MNFRVSREKSVAPFRNSPRDSLPAVACWPCVCSRYAARASLLRTKGVADRGSDAKDVIGMEFEIIMNVVIVGFGADEEGSPDVIAHSYTGVHQEMRVVDVGGAAATIVAIGLLVKHQGLAADSSHEVAANF